MELLRALFAVVGWMTGVGIVVTIVGVAMSDRPWEFAGAIVLLWVALRLKRRARQTASRAPDDQQG